MEKKLASSLDQELPKILLYLISLPLFLTNAFICKGQIRFLFLFGRNRFCQSQGRFLIEDKQWMLGLLEKLELVSLRWQCRGSETL